MSDNPNLNEAPITGTEPGQQAGDTKTERTFTQADLDRMIKERLDKQERSLLQKLGVTSLDEAKAAAQRVKEIDEASKTEVQKLQERLAETELKANRLAESRKVALLRAAAITEASKQGVAQDRLNAALKLLDTSKIITGDDDTVQGVEDAIKSLLEENPFLKAASQPDTPVKSTPKVGATNPAATPTEGGVKSWHPLYKQQSAGGFSGHVIEPQEGNKK